MTEHKVYLSPRKLLEVIKYGLENGSVKEVITIIDEALMLITDDITYARFTEEEAP